MRHRRGEEGWGAGSAWALVVAAVLLSGCTASGDAAPSTAASSPPSSAVASERSPSAPSATARTPGVEADVVAVYERYLDATAAAMASGDPASPELLRLAEGQALAAAQAKVAGLVSQGRIAEGSFVPDVQSTDVQAGSATLRDCYRADITEHDRDSGEEVADRGGMRFSATAQLTREGDGRWVVTSFEEGDVCVPADLAAEVEDRYLEFWDVLAEASAPPDPDHPALDEVAAGEQLEGLRQRLQEFREQGYEARGRNTPHPRAIEVSDADTLAVVLDCRELDPDAGVYDAETGERIQGGAEPGDRSLWESRLELIDGSWKVVDADLIEEDSQCDPASP